MEILESLVLGIIQGISEFLPISSSGHLALAPAYFGWQDQGLTFDIALHFGTAIAVIWYFWKDWKKLLSSLWISLKTRKAQNTDQKLIWLIIIATIPAGVFGWLFEDIISTYFRHPLFISYALIFTGASLYLVDELSKKAKDLKKIGFWNGLLIGIAQVLAIMPGISRSGITILAARAQGFDRIASTRFSFLLATPIILAATVSAAINIQTENVNILALILGTVAAAATGYFAIKLLLNYLKKHSFAYIALYVILLGIITLYIL